MAPLVIQGAADGNLANLYGPSGVRGIFQNRFLFSLGVAASFGGLLFGYDQGVISGVLVMNSFARTFPRLAHDANLQGWMVAVLQLGACFGAIVNGPIADRFSRKYSIAAANVVFILGGVLQTTVKNITMMFVGRFFAGIAIGQLSMSVPLYLGEIAPPNVRGSLVTLQQWGISIGIMTSFWINYGTQYIGGSGNHQKELAWRLPIGLQMVPSVFLLLISTLFLPFSPRWLFLVGREEEAVKSLARIRRLPQDHIFIQQEIYEIKLAQRFDAKTVVERYPNAKTKWKQEFELYNELITVAHLRKRLFVSCLMQLIQQFTGINAIIYYAPTIFGFIGLSGNSIHLLATGVVGIINVLSTSIAFVGLDLIGRRTILLVGAVGMGISQLIVATLYAVHEHSWSSHRSAGWAAAVFIWIFIANFAYSIGCVNWVYPSEIFPPSVRSKAIGIAVATNWICNFIIGLVTPRMLTSIRFGTFYFFFAFCVILFVWVFFFLPETKGVPMEEMDIIWGGNQAAEDLERMARVMAELQNEEGNESLDPLARAKQASEHVEMADFRKLPRDI
ncbi:general substrate transporter [Lipomyces orientalis]|uniref:General substrate transporter n=1 Tax=Lipomyces orientalis TaxID=1233043 RepID=A0ACC3TDY0_9ASCO